MWRYNSQLERSTSPGPSSPPPASSASPADPTAVFVVDALASIDPRRPRSVMVRGSAEAIDGGGHPWSGSSPTRSCRGGSNQQQLSRRDHEGTERVGANQQDQGHGDRSPSDCWSSPGRTAPVGPSCSEPVPGGHGP